MAEEYMKQLAETVAMQQNQITSLVEAIQQMPGVQQPVAVTVNPAVVTTDAIKLKIVARAEKDCQNVQDKARILF